MKKNERYNRDKYQRFDERLFNFFDRFADVGSRVVGIEVLDPLGELFRHLFEFFADPIRRLHGVRVRKLVDRERDGGKTVEGARHVAGQSGEFDSGNVAQKRHAPSSSV